LGDRYKCHTCKLIIDDVDLVDGNCPVCGFKDGLQKMCRLDHCHCGHDKIGTTAMCPECGAMVCPECGCHDVFVVSRVTGYLAELSGFNAGKRQEFLDRVRYTI